MNQNPSVYDFSDHVNCSQYKGDGVDEMYPELTEGSTSISPIKLSEIHLLNFSKART